MKQLALILSLCLLRLSAMVDESEIFHDDDEALLLIKKYTNLTNSPAQYVTPSDLLQPLAHSELPPSVKKETSVVTLKRVKKAETPLTVVNNFNQTADQGYKPFQCFACNRSFKTNKEKINHFLRNHQTEKPFECKFCAVAYTTRSSYLLHQKRKHGPLIYVCHFCRNQSFALRGDRNQHLKRKHHILVGNCAD